MLEPQNFHTGKEDKLMIQSNHAGTEVILLNLKINEIVNLSKLPNSYDEPEGIYPDGEYTLVESDKRKDEESKLDLYKLKHDTSESWERIAYLNFK